MRPERDVAPLVFALLAALLLSACVYSSQAPFFFARDAAQPFADGARFLWSEAGSSDEPDTISYRRDGAAYRVAGESGEEAMEVLFVPVRATPLEDYILQVLPRDSDEGGRMYAFMWREGEDYLIFASPAALDRLPGGPAARARSCVTLSYGECQARSREGLMRLYTDVIFPGVIKGGLERDDIMIQSPIAPAQ